MRAFTVAALAALALGCSPRDVAPVPDQDAPCAHLGDRCRLPDGPVGICNETTGPCDEPPCLACMSQH